MGQFARRAFALIVCLSSLLLALPARAQLLSPGPLSKAHAGAEGDDRCNDCHASGKRIDTASCVNKCHSDLGARISAGQGLHGREYKGKACESCHSDHLGRNARLVRWDPKQLNHAQTGWPLENGHKAVACEKCHNKSNARGAPTYLGLGTSCASCHKDQHEGRFGATCNQCHNDVSWKKVKLDGFNHDLAHFPLRGSHQKVTCEKCHHEPPQYKGIDSATCASCHKDPHAGKLGAKCASCHNEDSWKKVRFSGVGHPGVSLGGGHARVACGTCHDKGNQLAPSKGSECASCHRPVHEAPFGRGCGTCHGNIAWLNLPRPVGLAAHSKTAYPLTGEHKETPCASCHKPTLSAQARYRDLQFAECKDCHKDSHNGEFQARGGGECKACHATSGFRPALFGVALHGSTKFPLTGLHSVVACSGCHTSARPRLDHRVSKQACADCHENPHGAQFATEMAKGGCGQCHQTSGWNNPKIDHSTWPLSGAHAQAACEGCHKPSKEDKTLGKGASYRGVPRACGGCHDDTHAGQFRTSAPVRECDFCHSTTAFKVPAFEHAQKTRYPLTGGHAKAKCDGCHLKETLTSGAVAVRYRLPSTDCRTCHANPHDKALGGGGPK